MHHATVQYLICLDNISFICVYLSIKAVNVKIIRIIFKCHYNLLAITKLNYSGTCLATTERKHAFSAQLLNLYWTMHHHLLIFWRKLVTASTIRNWYEFLYPENKRRLHRIRCANDNIYFELWKLKWAKMWHYKHLIWIFWTRKRG
jgi:hypothetical protein